MNLKELAQELVELVKVDRNGQERHESMPRWLAEIAIFCIPAEEPEVAFARIVPIHVDPRAPYPLRAATLEQTWGVALCLANFLSVRLAA